MKIIHVASEFGKLAKTGGLADVTSSLSDALAGLGHDVSIFMPRYRQAESSSSGFKKVLDSIEVTLGHQKEKGAVFSGKLPSGVTVYLIDHAEFFSREFIYGTYTGDYADNDRRFTFFQRAVLATIDKLNLDPDIVHCHDWQTGLIPVYLKTREFRGARFKKIRTVFTIHNLAYQGNFPPDSLPVTGLGWEHFRFDLLEFYGKVSFIKGGLVFADAVTTVSERYTREIQTKEFGCGLDAVLRERAVDLHGIVNGINPQEWDPQTDKALAACFSASNPAGKEACKFALQKENEWAQDEKTPVFAFVSRLVGQKGLDVLIPAFEALSEMGIQLLILGTGEERYHQALRDLAKKNREWLKVHIVFDPDMAKQMYAGSDFFLLPSLYEPCGLGQMIALRYGTIPLVRETGGLADTVVEFDPATGEGNGFVFQEYKPEALVDAIRRAVKVFKKKKEWQQLQQNAFACDYSWEVSAKKYVELYQSVKPVKVRIDRT